MSSLTSESGSPSKVFKGLVGRTYSAAEFDKRNYIFDDKVFDSDGSWAFCRFSNEEFPAARIGFQKGGFNIWDKDTDPQKNLLQLHLELVTRDGAVLWIPTGTFGTDSLSINEKRLGIELITKGREIFSISGWPDMRWHFRSIEGDAEAEIQFTVPQATLLPDCILPYCTFAMWEAVADVSGKVRYKDSTAEVMGKVFYDHPRILNIQSRAAARRSYLFTPLYFEDGGAFFGYHADDSRGQPIPYYCFGTYIDTGGRSAYSTSSNLTDIAFDENHLPSSWKIEWTGGDNHIRLDVSVKPVRILKSWGAAAAPTDLKNFWVYPLVTECSARIKSGSHLKDVRGYGLSEYFNTDYWPAPTS